MEHESPSFADIFKGRRTFLAQRLDVCHGLLEELLDRKVLTKRHVDDIKTGSTRQEKVDKMLEILECRANSMVSAFKEALIANDQQYIWDDYLSKAIAVIPVHVNVTSNSPESNPLPTDFDGTFLQKLVTAVKLLKRHLQPAEISSIKANLKDPDLHEIDQAILLSKLDSKIENAFRQHGIDVETIQSLKVAFRMTLLLDCEPTFAHQSHSVVIYLLCTSAAGVANARKLMDSNALNKLLTAAVVEHLGSSGCTVELRINPEDFDIAMKCFYDHSDVSEDQESISVQQTSSNAQPTPLPGNPASLLKQENEAAQCQPEQDLKVAIIRQMEANMEQSRLLLKRLAETDLQQPDKAIKTRKIESDRHQEEDGTKLQQKIESGATTDEKKISLDREAELSRREAEFESRVNRAQVTLIRSFNAAFEDLVNEDSFDDELEIEWQVPRSRCRKPKTCYIVELPPEVTEIILMKVFVRIFLSRCVMLLLQGPYSNIDFLQYSFSRQSKMLNRQKQLTKLNFKSQLTLLRHDCYEDVATVCVRWWQTMVWHPDESRESWFTRNLRQNLLRLRRESVLLKVASVRESLPDLIEPNYGLLDELMASDILTGQEYSTVQTGQTVYAKNTAIIRWVASTKCEDRCRALVRALKKADQEHVANYISIQNSGVSMHEFGDFIPLDNVRKKLLNDNRRNIIESINMHEEFLSILLAEGCINRPQHIALKATEDPYARARSLIDILTRRSVADFNKFVDCLISDDQGHLAGLLQT